MRLMVSGSGNLARVKEGIIIACIVIFTIVAPGAPVGRGDAGGEQRGYRSPGGHGRRGACWPRTSTRAAWTGPKSAVRWIAASLKGDRMGLILFAGDAFLQCPLTADMGAFMMFLDGAGPDALNLQGTDIGRALDEALKVFQKKRLTSKILVLITDGEDHEGRVMESAKKFSDLGVAVYTLGVGREGGTAIPADAKERSGDIYYKDAKGGLIMTRRNSGLLKKLAGATGGTYIDISGSLSGLRPLLGAIEEQEKTKLGSRVVKEPKERFAIFALLLIVLLSVELMIAERKR